MPRNYTSTARLLRPDPKFQSLLATKIINKLMWGGKRSTAQGIFYDAIDLAHKKLPDVVDPAEIFTKAIENVRPMVEVRSKRVGGANYQVPVEVRSVRRNALAMRWLRDAARKRAEKSMDARLASELAEAAEGRGGAMKKREEVHRMADANKAFAHYRF